MKRLEEFELFCMSSALVSQIFSHTVLIVLDSEQNSQNILLYLDLDSSGNWMLINQTGAVPGSLNPLIYLEMNE